MAFALKHCLTGEALADLLLLIEAHCLSPNQCRKTVTMFTEYFKSVRAPLEYHYFCSNCHCYFGLVQTAQCSECDKNTQNDVAYFIVIPIVQQLTTLFQGTVYRLVFCFVYARNLAHLLSPQRRNNGIFSGRKCLNSALIMIKHFVQVSNMLNIVAL